MNIDAHMNRAQYAYDNRMPDEDTATEEAYRELERITDDPDELEEALAEDGTDRGLARLIVARYYTAGAELRDAVDHVVEGVIKKRGEAHTLQPAIRELIAWNKALSARVLALEKAAIRQGGPPK